MKTLLRTLACLGFFFGWMSAGHAEALYALDGGGVADPKRFGVLNTATGVFTPITTYSTLSNPRGFGVLGNNLYLANGAGTSELFSVHQTTGALSAPTVLTARPTIFGSSDAGLYARTIDAGFVSFSTTGQHTTLTANLLNSTSFSNGGSELYALQSNANDSFLFRFNTSTNSFAQIGATGLAGGGQFWGMGFGDGTLYAAYSGGKLYSFNTQTGAATFVTNITGANGQLQGLSAAPLSAIPEPAAWLLAMSGFGLVGWRARQKRSRESACDRAA